MASARESVTVKDVEAKLEEAYQILAQEKPEIPERLYKALEGISSVFYAWHKSAGKKGWSTSLVNPNGKQYFTKQQRILLEEAFNTYGPMFAEVFEDAAMVGGGSVGGGASMSNLKLGPTSSLIQPPMAINPEDISIDKLYHAITTRMDQYDDQWKSISSSLGIVKTVEDKDYKGIITIPMAPPIPVPYYILGKTIFPFLVTILDSLRLLLGGPFFLDIGMIRVFLSIVLVFIDLIRGDWQTALLSSLGVLSSGGVVIGITGKIIRNAWLFISPDLQKQLRDDIFRSSKSMVVGFLLWSFSIFSPDAIRLAVNKSFDKLREIVEKFNQKITDVETQVQQVASSAGVKVTFPRVPLTIVPSMDDIQNLQTIARVPEVYCSPEVQAILQPILLVPPLRLVLELLNIPTVPEMVQEQCKAVDTTSLAKSVSSKVQPTIEIIPGGPLNQATAAMKQATNAVSAVKNTVQGAANKVTAVTNTVSAVKDKVGAVTNTVSAVKNTMKNTANKVAAVAKGGTRKRHKQTSV